MLAPFVKKDNLSYKEVKQCIQSFVYGVNTPSRWGTQSPFSNITIDWNCPEDLRDQPAIVGGVEQDFTYGDCKAEMDMVNRAFMEIMMEGDYDGKGFAYPIPTYSITKDFDWSESENLKMLFGMAAKYGIPYFSNYVNSDMKPSDVRSMCCRLRLDLREIVKKKGGGYFGSGDKTGCYDDETEILTMRGWIPFEQLTYMDTVYTLNKHNQIELHHPERIFRYEYDGDLIHFHNSRFDQRVTPNHRMVVDMKTSHERTFIRADQYDGDKHFIPKRSYWDGEYKDFFTLPSISCTWIGGNYNSNRTKHWPSLRIRMNDWLKFLGLFISEGSFDNDKIAPSHGYRVFITQVKENNLPKIEAILSKLPFKFKREKNAYVICNKQLWMHLRASGVCYTKRIPAYVQMLSKEQLQIFFDALMLGDGSIRKIEDESKVAQQVYYTSSYYLASDFQELVLKLGYCARIRVRNRESAVIDGRQVKTNDGYEISIDHGASFSINKCDIKREHYTGYVYCCQVPNHTVYVRRNGMATWCGNSTGVVTLNFPRLGYLAKDKDDFYKRLDNLLDIAARSLAIKRETVTQLMENGLYPYTKRYIGSFDTYFNTIATVGMNEMCLNAKWIQKDIASVEGKEFTIEVLHHILDRLPIYQEQYGYLFNLESAPAESTCYRLAKHDKERYPDIKTAGTEKVPYYTNSSNLPVGYTGNIYEALEHQDPIQTLYTSGTVFHAYLGEALPDWKAAATIIKKICENYRLPYITLSPTFSVCPEHGYIKGEHYTCPVCESNNNKGSDFN